MTTRMVVAMLGLAACTGAMGPAGPVGPQGDEGPQGIPGPTGRPARELHLIVASNGVDLGLFIGGNCAWNERAGGELCYGTAYDALLYSTSDCTGAPYVGPSAARRYSVLFVDREGRVWKQEPVRTVSILSGWADNQCKPFGPLDLSAHPLIDTGVSRAEYRPEDLALSIQ